MDRDRRDGAEGEQLGAEGREVGRVVEGEVVCFAVPVWGFIRDGVSRQTD